MHDRRLSRAGLESSFEDHFTRSTATNWAISCVPDLKAARQLARAGTLGDTIADLVWSSTPSNHLSCSTLHFLRSQKVWAAIAATNADQTANSRNSVSPQGHCASSKVIDCPFTVARITFQHCVKLIAVDSYLGPALLQHGPVDEGISEHMADEQNQWTVHSMLCVSGRKLQT